MSILNAKQILEAHKQGKIIYHSPFGYKIEDFTKNQSVDIHLGNWLCFPCMELSSPMAGVTGIITETNATWKNLEKSACLVIPQGVFFLAHTEEFIGTAAGSNIHPQWHLRSTMARLGWGHAKAGWGDVGYHNRWAMGFYTYTALVVQAGMRVGQISFTETLPGDSDYTKETGNYQKDDLQNLFENWKKEDILPKMDNI